MGYFKTFLTLFSFCLQYSPAVVPEWLKLNMTLSPHRLIICISMLFCKNMISVQGRVVDTKEPPGKFNETMADAGNLR